MLKNLPTMQETWVRSLGLGDALEEEMVTHSNIPAWRIPWTEEPVGLQSKGCKELDTTEGTYHHTCIWISAITWSVQLLKDILVASNFKGSMTSCYNYLQFFCVDIHFQIS